MKKILLVKKIRLPDLNNFNTIRNKYSDYGRFGITKSGDLWVGDIRSSHPNYLIAGYYWATNENTLFVSCRGSCLDEKFLTKEIISLLIKKLKLDKSFSYFKET